jgi:hypothetical protein
MWVPNLELTYLAPAYLRLLPTSILFERATKALKRIANMKRSLLSSSSGIEVEGIDNNVLQ